VVAAALAIAVVTVGVAGTVLASLQLRAIGSARREYEVRIAGANAGARQLEYGAIAEDELAFAPRVPSVASFPSSEQFTLLPVELRHAYRERLQAQREWRRFGTVGWTTAATVTAGLIAVPAFNSVRHAIRAASAGSAESTTATVQMVLWIVGVATALGVPGFVAVRARMSDRQDQALERAYKAVERRLADPDKPLAGA